MSPIARTLKCWKALLNSQLMAAIAVVIVSGSAARGEPATPDKLNWRGPCYNCYNYAANRKTVFFAQPQNRPAGGFTCAGVAAAARGHGLLDDANHPGGAAAFWQGPQDGAQPAGWPAGQCPAGFCLVALVVRAGDYHWYRLNGDTTWSHKPGQTAATCKDAAGANMGAANPPHLANVAPYTFCKYMCMPAPPAAWNPIARPQWTAAQLAAWRLVANGMEDFKRDLSDANAILARLPTPNPIPDPQWTELAQLEDKGVAMIANPVTAPQFPPYLRVYNGVVAYYSNMEGDQSTIITYYADDRGLGSYLAQELSDPVPTVSEWSLIVLGATLLLAGIIVVRRLH